MIFRFFEVVFSCMFFLNLFLFFKLPHRCPKQGGGVEATFGQCPKGSSFFLRIASPSQRLLILFFYNTK